MLPGETENPYQQVLDEADLLSFIERVDGFFDAEIREMAFLWRGHVSETRQMHGHGFPRDGILIIQSQVERCPVIELRCRGVSKIRIDARLDLDVDAEIAEERIVLYLAGRHNADSYVLEMEQLDFRIFDKSYLGRQIYVVPQDLQVDAST